MEWKGSISEGVHKAWVLAVVSIFAAIFTAVVAVLIIPIHAVILMVCWNYALTTLFKLPVIGFWQSLCIVVVFRILVRSGTEISLRDSPSKSRG